MLAEADFADLSGAAAFNHTARRNQWPVLCDDTCQFHHSSLNCLLDVWRQASEGNSDGIPHRRMLTARKLSSFMRSLAIYERTSSPDGDRRYRVRLFGGGWVDFYGELTGKFLDEAIPKPFLSRWHALPDAAIGARSPLRMVARCDTFGKSHMTTEMLCAPMRADDGTVRFALLASHFDGKRSWEDVASQERGRTGPCHVRPRDTW